MSSLTVTRTAKPQSLGRANKSKERLLLWTSGLSAILPKDASFPGLVQRPEDADLGECLSVLHEARLDDCDAKISTLREQVPGSLWKKRCWEDETTRNPLVVISGTKSSLCRIPSIFPIDFSIQMLFFELWLSRPTQKRKHQGLLQRLQLCLMSTRLGGRRNAGRSTCHCAAVRLQMGYFAMVQKGNHPWNYCFFSFGYPTKPMVWSHIGTVYIWGCLYWKKRITRCGPQESQRLRAFKDFFFLNEALPFCPSPL